MTARILVTGGTGTLGVPLVALLRGRGHDVRTASRRDGVDLRTGDGLEPLLDNDPVVIHCASDVRRAGHADEAMTRVLLDRARGKTPHLIYVSIVGVDRNPLRYYRHKYATEQLVEHGGSPWTILRATQFHELFDRILHGLTRLPVIPTTDAVTVQPVAARDVAARLAELAAGPPSGNQEFGGPEFLTSRQVITTYLQETNRHRPQVSSPVPGKVGRAFRSGAATTVLSSGTQTWRQFLEEKYG